MKVPVLVLLLIPLIAGCARDIEPNMVDHVNLRTFGIHEVTPKWNPHDKLLIKSAIDQRSVMLIEHHDGARVFVQPSVAAGAVIIYVKDRKGVASGAAEFEYEHLSGIIKVEPELNASDGVMIYHGGEPLLTYEIGPDKSI